MNIEIKLQSYSNIITNSSSELFIINSHMDADSFKDIWERALREHHYDIDSDGYSAETYHGYVYHDDESDKLLISFPVMCNLGTDMYDWLEELFGKENISYGE